MGLNRNKHHTTKETPTVNSHDESDAHSSVSGGNPYLVDSEQGLKLLAQLISVGDENSVAQRKLAELANLVEKQFLPLTESDFNTTGARAYRDLMRICADLEELVQFPVIERHYTLAVGGMFSAGKSRFLNSILGCDLLPTDTNPTTSIPTYLTHGDSDRISPESVRRTT